MSSTDKIRICTCLKVAQVQGESELSDTENHIVLETCFHYHCIHLKELNDIHIKLGFIKTSEKLIY